MRTYSQFSKTAANLRIAPFKLTLVILALLADSQVIHAVADGPDYWQVSGVEKYDVLNIRSSADFNAPITGEIPHEGRCVKNLGCRGGLTFNEFTTLSDSEKRQIIRQRPRWCRVSYKGTIGWVAGRYLKEGDCSTDEQGRHAAVWQGIDPYNHSYLIEKEIVTLQHGYVREIIPGATAVIITEIVHHPVYVDLNGDGLKEAVSVLMRQTGGSGTFFYLAAAGDVGGAIESYFLGDRVDVVSVRAVNDIVTVEYFERDDSQPMATRPAVRTSLNFKLVANALVSDSEP